MNENASMVVLDQYLEAKGLLIQSPEQYKKAVSDINELIAKNPPQGSDDEIAIMTIGRSLIKYEKVLYETVFNSNYNYH